MSHPVANPFPSASPDDRVTCVDTSTLGGELAAGDVLLDGLPIGRVSRHILPGRVAWYRELSGARLPPPVVDDLIWHVEAVGWVPHSDRPWDRRISRTAPSRRRAIEDLLRAYGNRR